MTSKTVWRMVSCILVAALAVSAYGFGQREERPTKAKLVTLHGTVVDLYSYMTGLGAAAAKNDEDHVKLTRENLKNGVPACIETEDALVILGKGARAPVDIVMPLAGQEVEVRGKLYEKDGVQFVDIVAIKAVEVEPEEPAAEEGEEAEEEGEAEEP